MTGRFLHEGISLDGRKIDYGSLKRQLIRNEVIVATWLTNRRSGVRVLHNEREFKALVNDAAQNPAYYHLRFFASLDPGNSYFDYNPTKGPKFVDQGTPHWKAMTAYDQARFTVRPDDISVLTKVRQLCIPWCEPFAVRLSFDKWLEIVPGFQIRRIADENNELKYRLLDDYDVLIGTGKVIETPDWDNVTPVLQLRRSPHDRFATEFRYRG